MNELVTLSMNSSVLSKWISQTGVNFANGKIYDGQNSNAAHNDLWARKKIKVGSHWINFELTQGFWVQKLCLLIVFWLLFVEFYGWFCDYLWPAILYSRPIFKRIVSK